MNSPEYSGKLTIVVRAVGSPEPEPFLALALIDHAFSLVSALPLGPARGSSLLGEGRQRAEVPHHEERCHGDEVDAAAEIKGGGRADPAGEWSDHGIAQS